MNELNGIVSQIITVSPTMKIFRIAPDGWELPDFKAGQFCALSLPSETPRCKEATPEFEEFEAGKLVRRAYSIASSSRTKEYLEFYITLVHSGSLTSRLFTLNIGDRIGVGKKFVGMFTIDQIDTNRNIVLIATGTGVAPYMSMLRSQALSRKGKIAVIHGASNSWDLGYSSELDLLQSITTEFKYLPTITEPDKEMTPWNGHVDFIQDMWNKGIMEKTWGFKPMPENTDVFLCGNPHMIAAMEEAMSTDGFTEWHKKKNPEGQIHAEKF